MRALNRANRALVILAEWLALAGGFAIFLLMIMMALDATGRKTIGAFPGSHEFSEALMVPAVFLPLMYVQMQRGNVFVSVATLHLPVRTQALLDGFAALVGVALFVILTWFGLTKAMDSFIRGEYRVAIISVPIWPFRWFIPFGTALLVFQLVLTAIQDFSRAFGRDEPLSTTTDSRLPPG